MDDEIKAFIQQHNMVGEGDIYNYHVALSFYYAYSVDGYRLAENIENGELFDEHEVSAVIKYLYIAKKTLNYFKKKLKIPVDQFDTSETVRFQNCTLEKGHIVGDMHEAISMARKWMKTIQRDIVHRKEVGKQEIFLYEVALFIMYLTGEEVDYKFLEHSNFQLDQEEENFETISS